MRYIRMVLLLLLLLLLLFLTFKASMSSWYSLSQCCVSLKKIDLSLTSDPCWASSQSQRGSLAASSSAYSEGIKQGMPLDGKHNFFSVVTQKTVKSVINWHWWCILMKSWRAFHLRKHIATIRANIFYPWNDLVRTLWCQYGSAL